MATYHPDSFKDDLIQEVVQFIEPNISLIPDMYGISIWCENHSPDLAQIYQKYIGIRHSLIYASHTMYFIHATLREFESTDRFLDTIRSFIECQLYDFPLATDGSVSL